MKEKRKIKRLLKSPVIYMILTLVFSIILSHIETSRAITTYLYDSKDVSYDNTESGIIATDVQGAVDELYACASDYSGINTRVTTIESQIYPVGSIYISVNNTNPSTIFGGTWERFGKGKTLVGLDEEDDDYNTSEGIGGAKNVTLTVNNLPSHSHSFTPAGSVTSTFSGTRKTTESAGAHTHPGLNGGWAYVGSGSVGGIYFNTNANVDITIRSAGAHTHYYTPAGSVTSTFTGTAGTTENTGSGDSFSIMNPYITVYMWKRTA